MKVKKYSILSAIIITASLSLGIATYAAGSAEVNHDIGCYEYGYESHERRTPAAVDETFDPSVYGENNNSYIYVAGNGDDVAGHDCPSKHLKDVETDAWYHEYIDYVVEKGLMQGVAADQFAPGLTTTRAMIVTILYRLEGQPVITGASPFGDVATGQWYTDAIIWANSKGIVEGYGNGKFGPNDLITREQFAAIMYRYANFKGYDTSKTADLSGYTDAGSISGYAVDAMKWANAENLITGRTTTTLVPRGEATRAEVAAILMRFIHSEIIGEDNIAEGVIRQLQKEIAFGEQDIVTFFSNGYLKSIDIKTQKTAEMLFMCIRNCEGITDLTDVNLQPMALPIEINGQGMGTFREFYITYQETGQFICISFTPEDSERFQDYVMSLR